MDFPVVLVYFEPKKDKYAIPTRQFRQMTAKDILRDALERNKQNYILFLFNHQNAMNMLKTHQFFVFLHH